MPIDDRRHLSDRLFFLGVVGVVRRGLDDLALARLELDVVALDLDRPGVLVDQRLVFDLDRGGDRDLRRINA